jgi:hypothetical protein
VRSLERAITLARRRRRWRFVVAIVGFAVLAICVALAARLLAGA